MASVAVFVLAWGWWAYPLPDGSEASLPVVYLDAQGREIATFHGLNGRYQIWLPLDRMPPVVVGAVIAAEDRRFMRHLGVDLLAVSRAAVHNARGGEVVRGSEHHHPAARPWSLPEPGAHLDPKGAGSRDRPGAGDAV